MPKSPKAAVAAAREGKNSVILERSGHVGGLPVNGLGATDIATRGATAGLFARFVTLNKARYTEKYGAGSPPHAAAPKSKAALLQKGGFRSIFLCKR